MGNSVLKPDQLEFLQELAENSVSGHFVWKHELLELVRVYEVVMSAPRGLVEQAWTRKVTHEVTMDVTGGSIEMGGRTYRLVDEGKLIGAPTRDGDGGRG